MRVVGTAGHVDHGKSTLIAALTGIHPDRLKEERAREMTIDLGFAWLDLPSGETVGIVDVPGHRDFIENMLAGVGGIDAALFVIAADEGVMPQTREHLAILDILQIQTGILVLTKVDLAEGPDWLDLVEADVREAVQGTVLADAPLVRVSARTGAGLAELVQVMEKTLLQQPNRPDLGRPRLPVDRVFTMPGFGTVVTGTLTDGKFHLGEEIEILPDGLHGRIRGLQTHNRKEDEAVPGSRTAINISGVDVDQIARGDVIALPGKYQATRWIDVQFRLLADASAPLKHSSEVKLFIGAAEVLGRVRLLGVEELHPGEVGWLQLELRDPAVALRGDHYILRRPSPGETLGGGLVVDPHPEGRHKRFSQAVLHKLEAYLQGSPDEVLLQASQALGPAPVREVVLKARLETNQANETLAELYRQGQLLVLEEGDQSATGDALVIARPDWEALATQAVKTVAAFHKSTPLRRGMPREELKSRLKLSPRLFSAVMRRTSQEGRLVEMGSLVRSPDHEIRLNPRQQEAARALLARFGQAPYSPPSVKEAQAEVGEDLYNALVETVQLVPVSAEVVFRKSDYDRLVEGVREFLEREGTITVAQFRDLFNTSRKYALGMLEHLDQAGMTSREGDIRRLRRPVR